MDEIKKQIPPYVSYKTFNSFMRKLQPCLPTHIDRSSVRAMYSDHICTQLMSAMRFLNLIDTNSRPTARLKVLAPASGEHLAVLLRYMAEEAYPFIAFKWIIDAQNSTYAELEAVFQKIYPMKIDVCHKCIRFFIEYCKDAGIPLSPQITEKRKVLRSNQEMKNTNKKLDIRSDIYHGRAIPPSKYLKNELMARNISQEEFTRRMGIPSNALNEIINGNEDITAKMALKLEEVIPTFPARFWLYLQSDFQLTEALIAKR